MNELTAALSSIALAIVGLATLSVLISKNANTSSVINSLSGALSSNIAAATNPVTGGGLSSVLGNVGTYNFNAPGQ